MSSEPKEWEVTRKSLCNTDQRLPIRPPLWWLAFSAPLIAFLLIAPLEGIASYLKISMFYGLEKGVHWYITFWILGTLLFQMMIGVSATFVLGAKIQWGRLFRVGLLTSILGTLLIFASVWLAVIIAFG